MSRIVRYTVVGAMAFATCGAALMAGSPKPAAPESASGPAWLGPQTQVRRTAYPDFQAKTRAVPEIDPRPLVWVIDGAGDFRGCSNAMSNANMTTGNTFEMSHFVWSHGYRRLILDQTDLPYARAQGCRLAVKIQERQAAEPGRRMAIVAHSAGAAVALAAGDNLPPDSIDRVILLAPSVSTGYDVRPTLRAAREGMDVFCSKKDWIALGFGTRVVGTTDKKLAPAAGRHGFQPRGEKSLDPCDTSRLRQHYWNPELTWTGNNGRHHGTLTPTFLQAYVFPAIGVRAGPG